MSALAYGLVRFAYVREVISAPSHGFWMAGLLFGSFALGVFGAGAAGLTGVGPVSGLAIGVAPAVGLLTGSVLTVAAGLGHYDSSPLVVGGMVVGAYAVCSALAWILGRIAGGTWLP